MYLSYYGMEFNPFVKDIETKYAYETEDLKMIKNRLNYIKENPGLAVFTGNAGLGKTFAIRDFLSNLNSNLYKTIYVSLSNITVLEFYKAIAYGLGIDPLHKKIDIFRQIQETVINIVKNKKQQIIICIDEAQYLKTEIINDLKILMNFEMDSKNYFSLVLIGHPFLNDILNKNVHESIKQRITVSYNCLGISKTELENYISTRMKLVHANDGIFNSQIIEAIFNSCNGSIRVVNNIITKALIISYQKQEQIITTDTIMEALNELSLG